MTWVRFISSMPTQDMLWRKRNHTKNHRWRRELGTPYKWNNRLASCRIFCRYHNGFRCWWQRNSACDNRRRIGWLGSTIATSCLNSVSFTSSDTGYITGNKGSILKTTDGGIYWVKQTSGTDNDLTDICFTSAHTGYAVAITGLSENQWWWKNWEPKTNNNSFKASNTITNHLYAVDFIDADTGYIVGEYGIILKTTDAGNTWITQPGISNETLRSVHFANTNTGYIAGGYGTIIKTTHAEPNFLSVSTDTITITAEANSTIQFTISSNTGWTIVCNEDWLAASSTLVQGMPP